MTTANSIGRGPGRATASAPGASAMPGGTPRQRGRAAAAPPRAASRVPADAGPRWPVVACVALLSMWPLLQVTSIAGAIYDSPNPAREARSHLRDNVHEIITIAVCTAAFFVVRWVNARRGQRTSFLAVLATLLVALNPAVLSVLFRMVGLRDVIPDGHVRSFMFALLALVVGLLATVHVRRSRGALTGTGWGVAGMTLGGLGVALGILTVFLLLYALTHMKH